MNTVRTELDALFQKLADVARVEYLNHDEIAPLREQPRPDRKVWVRRCLSGSEVTADCGLQFFKDQVYALDDGHEGTSILTVKGWFTRTSVWEACRGNLFRQHL